MSTFAVTNSDSALEAVNYLLTNLNSSVSTGNVTIPTGTLIANVTTGAVVPFNTGGTVYSYLYQFVNLRYANNSTGTSGFSTVPTNSSYFGVYNSVTQTPSTNPAAYQWQEVAGGFGTTKTIYYSTLGGRQVQWAAASSPPNTNFVVSVANVAIDLDVVTTAAGTPGERGPVSMAYVITTADPTTASSSTLTGWFEASRSAVSPPIGTGLTPPVLGDTAYFIYPTTGVSESYTFNGSTWAESEGQIVSGATVVANTLPGTAITLSTITGNLVVPGTLTGDLVAANTITATNIQTATITATQIAANTITAGQIAANTITTNQIAANTITATNIATGTITANQIAANTITATQISSSYIYAGNIVSFGATLNSNTSPGYWLNYSTGNARFGGNVSIGNNLSVGSNATIGANLSVTGLITSGGLNSNTVNTTQMLTNSATTVIFQGTVDGSSTAPVSYYNTVGNIYWPSNTRGFAIPAVAIRPTTDGSSSGSSILLTFTAGVQCTTDNQANLIELWRTGVDITFGNVFTAINFAVANTSSVTNNENMNILGYNQIAYNTGNIGNYGIQGLSSDGGDTWGFSTGISNSLYVDGPDIQINNAGNFKLNRVVRGGAVTSITDFGGPSGTWFTPSFLSSGRVLFTGQDIGNTSPSNDIGIITGPTAYITTYSPFAFSSPGPSTQTQLTTPTGVLSDIYDMDWGYNAVGNTQVKNAVFVCTGGDVLTTQFQFHSSNAQVTNTTVTLRTAPTDSNLFSVSSDRGAGEATIWIAVGEGGVIVRSTNNGTTWTQITSPTTENLRSVIGYGGEATKRFVAVGDDATIIMSSDGGLTWSLATVTLPTDGYTRNLNAVSFCPTSGTGSAGLWTAVGEGIIYKCDKTSTTWTAYYQENAIVNSGIKRLVYIGSNGDVYNNSTVTAQSIGNAVVSYTYQDTNYIDTVTYQYYLVVGNMNSAAGLTAKFPTLTVQEIKR